MRQLLQEITKEKLRKNPALGYIQRLQQLADKKKANANVSHSEFIGTGRIYAMQNYLTKYDVPRGSCHRKTQTVLVYMLGYKLDMLSTGFYYCEVPGNGSMVIHQDKSVKVLEAILYKKMLEEYSTKVGHF